MSESMTLDFWAHFWLALKIGILYVGAIALMIFLVTTNISDKDKS